MLSQLKGAPEFVRFLKWLLEEHYRANIFTGGYGSDRAYRDGQAAEADTLYRLITDLENL